MHKLSFQVDINAPREKVWNALWEDRNYRNWTSVFSEGSYAETDWKEGSKIKFMGPDGGGIYSLIAENRPNEYMSFKHLGELKNGVEQPASDWSGSMENYTLEERGGVTTVMVDIDVTDDFQDYFNKTWPKALEKLKEIAEG
jgi:uncharacterized protein YndB with AHSA1/START domain